MRRYIYKWLLIVAGIILLLGSFIYLYFYYQERPEVSLVPADMSDLPRETRLLVVAPHCDDETLGCAGIIRDIVAGGGQVRVVVMTNGDGFTFAVKEQLHRLFLSSADYIKSGYARQGETMRALQWLGITGEQIFFLGYPDRGLETIWTDVWDSSQPYRSRYTDSDHSPYTNSYQQHTPYTGEAVLVGLESILQDFKPTLLLVPHPADEHTDHAATWAFVATAYMRTQNSRLAFQPEVYTYLIHRGDYPIPHGYKKAELLLPPGPLQKKRNNHWYTYSLTADNEAVKEQALEEYISQLRVPIMSSLLYSFIRRNELFEKMQIPVMREEPAGVDLTSLESWQTRDPLLVNPRGVNPLGALERKANITAVAGVIQNNAIWLRLHIPDFSGKRMSYHAAIIAFFEQQGKVRREKKEFFVSVADTDLPAGDVLRFQDDVVIKLAADKQGLPDYFFIQITTEDIFSAVSNRTVWQPVLIQQLVKPEK